MTYKHEKEIIDFNFENTIDKKDIADLFLTMLNAAHNAIMAIDLNARITFMNTAAEELVGTPFREAKNNFISSIIKDAELPRILKTGIPETGLKGSVNGHHVLVNRNPIFYHGKMVGAVSLFQDISDLEAMIKELESVKQMNKELNAIIDSVYDGLIIADGDGTILRINPAYESIATVKPVDFVGKNVTQLVSEGFVSESVTLKVLETKRPVNLSIKVKSGRDLFHSSVPVFDKNGIITRVVTVIRDLTELTNLRRKLEEVEAEKLQYHDELKKIKDRAGARNLVSYSPQMKQIFQLAGRLSQFDTTVLISGESGVGKEIIARYIHENSLRSNKPFIRVNCGAIPDHLLESELFGYESGAFTGASRSGKKGLLDAAEGGSFLLDEISELPLPLQVKLLRFLQDHEFIRVGGNTPVHLNIRFIATSNKDLNAMVLQGLFRTDLFYRLNVVQIVIPPLRERREEIPALIMVFIKRFNEKYRQNKQFTRCAIDIMRNYDWPGNIRELENTVERLAITCPDDLISHHYVIAALPGQHNSKINSAEKTAADITSNLKQSLNDFEKEMIKHAYEQAGCTRKAAAILGINQSTVVKKMKKYGLSISESA